MKQGLKSIESLYGELMRQREMRKDLIADTKQGKTIIIMINKKDKCNVYISTDEKV